MLLARNVEYTKTPRESFLAAYDCRLAHSTHSHTPSGASLNFGGAVVSCEELSLSASEVQTFSWGCFFVSFVHPKFRPISTAAAPLSRGVSLC